MHYPSSFQTWNPLLKTRKGFPNSWRISTYYHTNKLRRIFVRSIVVFTTSRATKCECVTLLPLRRSQCRPYTSSNNWLQEAIEPTQNTRLKYNKHECVKINVRQRQLNSKERRGNEHNCVLRYLLSAEVRNTRMWAREEMRWDGFRKGAWKGV